MWKADKIIITKYYLIGEFESWKDPVFCSNAVAERESLLKYVSKEIRTSEFWLRVIQKDVEQMIFVPKELQTTELCLAAVEQDSYTLKYVREDLKTPELCLVSILLHFPSEHISSNFMHHSIIKIITFEPGLWNSL